MKVTKLPALLLSSSVAVASTLQKPLNSDLDVSSLQPIAVQEGVPSYRSDLIALHKSLVAIQSLTGNESEVGKFLVDYLVAHGFHAELEFVPPEKTSQTASEQKPRFNVLAWPSSTHNPRPKVLVSSHIDTVPPFFPYYITDDVPTSETEIGGRGSVDAKASVASQVIAMMELVQSEAINSEDVMLLYVVGEEVHGDGMRYFSKHLGNLSPPPKFKAGIFGEPTEGKLACGHKGFLGCTVAAKGRAGHSGYPWLGKSATEVMIRALRKILDTDLGSSDRFGNTTVNVGHIEGGVAANVIPAHAEANLAIRIAIGPQSEGAKVVEKRLWDVLKSVDEEAFEMSCSNGYGAIDCGCDIDGFESVTLNYGTDIANLEGNHTRYLYGPGTIFVAHGPDEALKLQDLESAVEGYKKIILHALDL